jgi:UrcA family protein
MIAVPSKAAIVAALAASTLLAPGFASAQAPAETPPAGEEQVIVVEAPRAVPLPPPPQEPKAPDAERSATTGAPIVTTTVRISALYGDLDLTRPEHGLRLMTRIERVAHDACATLDRLYPLTPDPDCVSRAVTRARPAADALIAGSTKK